MLLRTPRRPPARIALHAGPVPQQGEIPAFPAGIAFVGFIADEFCRPQICPHDGLLAHQRHLFGDAAGSDHLPNINKSGNDVGWKQEVVSEQGDMKNGTNYLNGL
jgi:hypothetical protein